MTDVQITHAPEVVVLKLECGDVLVLPGDALHMVLSRRELELAQADLIKRAAYQIREMRERAARDAVERSDHALEERAKVVAFLRAQAGPSFGHVLDTAASMIERRLHWRTR